MAIVENWQQKFGSKKYNLQAEGPVEKKLKKNFEFLAFNTDRPPISVPIGPVV